MYGILTQCPLFQGLDAGKIEELLSGREFSTEDFADGELVARRDMAYSGLMIILRGEVRGEVEDRHGKRFLIDRIQAPQLIAPAFLFGGYNRLPIDVVADGPVTILTLHRGLLFELMQENVIVMSNFIDVISDRANLLTRKIYFLSFRTVREKVMNYLLDQFRLTRGSVDVSDLNALSEYFDAPRSSIVTVLNEMEKHGLIAYDKGEVTILNEKALERQ
ncbi:Crp/Fnr family transcriptional regulator [Alistipes sp. OttesenSCG-928-L06]|nr:Crp/Fnr family transcriptional regulator [Alistipes sp. OttesenSCG-928-L06]